MRKGMTVNELKMFCEIAVRNGYGDKVVLISTDDEGNGYHTLWYEFMTDIAAINNCAYLFHDNNNPNDVVLLG